jgi:hypothetical protein
MMGEYLSCLCADQGLKEKGDSARGLAFSPVFAVLI